MPENEDGTNPGDDVDATNDGKGGNGDADKAGKGNDDKGDKGGNKAGQIVFNSQKDVDDMIARRVARAVKDKDDAAKLTNEQRLEKERDDALSLVRERDIRDDFVAKTGLAAGPAQRLFRAFRDDLDIDDKGKATNIEAVIKDAKKEFPNLWKPGGGKVEGGGDGDKGGGGKTGGDMNNALRRMAGRG
jgi:hypothetical protein